MNSSVRRMVAIVGEGATEWYYFDGLRRTKRYSFKLKPLLPTNSHWTGVLRKAKKLAVEPYDRIYCVIDLDTIVSNKREFDDFSQAVSRLANNKAHQKISLILSMPCIELWFLLHFQAHLSTKEYRSYDEIQPELQKYVPEYTKKKSYFARCNLYTRIAGNDREKHAAAYARTLEQLKSASESRTFPFTEIYKILEDLSSLNG